MVRLPDRAMPGFAATLKPRRADPVPLAAPRVRKPASAAAFHGHAADVVIATALDPPGAVKFGEQGRYSVGSRSGHSCEFVGLDRPGVRETPPLLDGVRELR